MFDDIDIVRRFFWRVLVFFKSCLENICVLFKFRIKFLMLIFKFLGRNKKGVMFFFYIVIMVSRGVFYFI